MNVDWSVFPWLLFPLTIYFFLLLYFRYRRTMRFCPNCGAEIITTGKISYRYNPVTGKGRQKLFQKIFRECSVNKDSFCHLDFFYEFSWIAPGIYRWEDWEIWKKIKGFFAPRKEHLDTNPFPDAEKKKEWDEFVKKFVGKPYEEK